MAKEWTGKHLQYGHIYEMGNVINGKKKTYISISIIYYLY